MTLPPTTIQAIDVYRSQGMTPDLVAHKLQEEHGLDPMGAQRVIAEYSDTPDDQGVPRGQRNPGEP